MKQFLCSAFCLLTLSGVAHAAITSAPPALCDALVDAVPDANVAYQPGVDVHGNKVAPADLQSDNAVQMPKQIQIPLTINLARAAHFNTSQYPFNQLGEGTEGVIGTITIEGNQVSFNGQPISDQQQQQLAVLCMKPR